MELFVVITSIFMPENLFVSNIRLRFHHQRHCFLVYLQPSSAEMSDFSHFFDLANRHLKNERTIVILCITSAGEFSGQRKCYH